MNDLRMCMIRGNLVKNPKIKELAGGKTVAQLEVAVNYDDTEGEKRVSFFDIEAWGQLAQSAAETLKKGQRVSVFGNLKQERWEKDGKTHSKIKIVATEITSYQAVLPEKLA